MDRSADRILDNHTADALETLPHGNMMLPKHELYETEQWRAHGHCMRAYIHLSGRGQRWRRARLAMQECETAFTTWPECSVAWRLYIELAMERAHRPDLAQDACRRMSAIDRIGEQETTWAKTMLALATQQYDRMRQPDRDGAHQIHIPRTECVTAHRMGRAGDKWRAYWEIKYTGRLLRTWILERDIMGLLREHHIGYHITGQSIYETYICRGGTVDIRNTLWRTTENMTRHIERELEGEEGQKWCKPVPGVREEEHIQYIRQTWPRHGLCQTDSNERDAITRMQ